MIIQRRVPFAHRRREAPQRQRVLNLLVRGLDNAAIAARLGMTIEAVRVRMQGLYRIHNVHSRWQLFAALGLPYRKPMPRRQAQVIAGLREGLTYRQIAARLGMTCGVTKNYVERIYRIHNVHSRPQLLARLRGRRLGTPSLRDGLCLAAAERRQNVAQGVSHGYAAFAIPSPVGQRRELKGNACESGSSPQRGAGM